MMCGESVNKASGRPRSLQFRGTLAAAAVCVACLCGGPECAAEEHASASLLIYNGRTSGSGNVEEGELTLDGANTSQPGTFPLDVEIIPDGIQLAAHRAFANETGRVRASVSAAGVNLVYGETDLLWAKTFTKAPGDTANFTVNKSFMRLLIGGLTDEVLPSTFLHMKVTLYNEAERIEIPADPIAGREARSIDPPPHDQFKHEAQIDQFLTGGVPFLVVERTTLFDSLVHDGTVDPPGDRVVASTFTSTLGSALYEMEPYHGVIDLSGIPDEGTYTIQYQLFVSAQHNGDEGVAEVFLGDPLDVDSGFVLDTTSAAAENQDPTVSCRTRNDLARFSYDTANATVTDAYTGLMWQRCPIGYTSNTNGTTDDLADDRCEAATDARANWQTDLQSGAASAVAGHTDWRVPSIKELESILEPNCRFPAIDSSTFPDTPADFFWSSTPDSQAGDAARALDFARGFSTARIQTSVAHARLVRTTDQPPVTPLPALLVSRAAAVEEGDGGNSNLVFSIELDRPSASDVTVDFATSDRTATAGTDYSSTSGTVLIPAGSRRAEVLVQVLDDDVAEPFEALELALANNSANARLIGAVNIGQINDDEPLVTIAPNSIGEGNAGTRALAFTVELDTPAAADVTINYATSDGTATAGSDYTATTAALLIPAGNTSGTILIDVLGDLLTEGDEDFTVTLSSVSSNARLSPAQSQALGSIVDDDTVTLRALNDTGIVLCANETSPALACTQTAAFPGQDAQFGRDATANDDTDGTAGFSFIKLDAGGTPLIDQTAAYTVTPWDCVQDEVTGMQWEVKTDDDGLRDREWTYAWFNSTGINDGGSAGTANGGVCVDSSNCDTEKYVTAVNAVGMCGRSDWRLATREELQSIGDISEFNLAPRYDINFFPNPPTALGASEHWTSTPDASVPAFAWSVNKLKGRSFFIAKSRAFPVRLVRGGN